MSAPIVCSSCRRPNDPWRRHCGGCGSGLPGGCSTCAFVNRTDDRFCGGCSRPLRAILPSTTPRKTPVPQAALHKATVPIDVRDVISETPVQTGTVPIDVRDLLPDPTSR
ncbi:MAG: hypothetical protein H0X17_01435 [Deltaproteobacteria bacterium]|nr:hypothetical protein [Deltaproteobacteria bacterium]